ncbi:hypothetical protein C0581_04540 [Candidatus Parcubacteria bacterium]|nr:MAG: hypothetical protein C0581_04540 [Candidatus Parcubacteria bacterium]
MAVWYFMFNDRDTQVVEDITNIQNPVENTVQEQENEKIIKEMEEKDVVYPDNYENDKDTDGISDVEEEKLGTSMWEPDSDGDGITDRVEIDTYGTDPTKPDSDGDGYWDGLEIISGYNPLGDGKL